MSFNNMLEILKEKNEGIIVLVKVGAFYIATGESAVFLNKEIGLKCTCFKKEVCKVGFPESAIERNLQKLREKNIGYVVYIFDGKNESLIERYRGEGKCNFQNIKNKNCLLCQENKIYDEKDKYMNALSKLLKEERKQHENRAKK